MTMDSNVLSAIIGIGGVVLGSLITSGIAFIIYKRTQKDNTKEKESHASEELGMFKEKSLSNEENIKKLESGLAMFKSEINHKLERIEDRIQDVNKILFSQKQSPRKLNSLGEKVFKDMNAQQWLDKNKQRLFELLNERNPQTAYDVESYAQLAVQSLSEDECFNEIKLFIYNYPTMKSQENRDIELTMSGAIFVLGLGLRDMYLNERTDIPRS